MKVREKQTKVRGGKTLVIEYEHVFKGKLSSFYFYFFKISNFKCLKKIYYEIEDAFDVLLRWNKIIYNVHLYMFLLVSGCFYNYAMVAAKFIIVWWLCYY